MIIYLLKSSLCLSAFLLVYYFILERENMHVFKRFYLLISLLFSFIVPFISFEFKAENALVAASNNLQTVVLPAIQISSEKNYFSTILYLIYGLITFAFLARFIWNLYTIQKVRNAAEIINFQNAKLALVDAPILPHTFGNTIFINKQSYESKAIETELFTHELTHVTEKHTLDVLFIELLKTVFWFNPLLILYKRAIQLNHEFLADQEVISEHETISIYQQLLLSKSHQTTNYYLTSNLNSFLKTKKRFIMMTKTTSTRTEWFKKALIAPLFLGMFIFGSSITFAQETPKQEVKAEEPIYESVEKRPDFPGGIQEFYNFVGKNFKMPNVDGLKGKVYIQFVVEADGKLTNIKVQRDIGHGTGEEAVRVLKLSPNWIPGEQDGKPVRVQYSLPISISGS
jgi:beta-lactamase regulating signal transducer with metallopeptidase domain